MHFPKPNEHDDIFGLPGGHVDAGEHPDETIVRELEEELAIMVPALTRSDFFLHRDGKIVLAYKGRVSKNVIMTPSRPEFEYGVWKSKSEFETLDINPSYKTFVLDNWPEDKDDK